MGHEICEMLPWDMGSLDNFLSCTALPLGIFPWITDLEEEKKGGQVHSLVPTYVLPKLKMSPKERKMRTDIDCGVDNI